MHTKNVLIGLCAIGGIIALALIGLTIWMNANGNGKKGPSNGPTAEAIAMPSSDPSQNATTMGNGVGEQQKLANGSSSTLPLMGHEDDIVHPHQLQPQQSANIVSPVSVPLENSSSMLPANSNTSSGANNSAATQSPSLESILHPDGAQMSQDSRIEERIDEIEGARPALPSDLAAQTATSTAVSNSSIPPAQSEAGMFPTSGFLQEIVPQQQTSSPADVLSTNTTSANTTQGQPIDFETVLANSPPANATTQRDIDEAKEEPETVVVAPLELRSVSIIHVWIKSQKSNENASLILRPKDCCKQIGSSGFTVASTQQTIAFKFFEIRPGLEGLAEMVWTEPATRVSYIYVFEEATVMDEGIRPAYIHAPAQTPHLPDSYHFRPPIGWLNDPNGLSKVGDHYHVFYQYYPHRLSWLAMHWGHTVTKDFVNYVHLPVFLHPDEELLLEYEGKGGIFSGSAIPLPIGNQQSSKTGLRMFYTDNNGVRTPPEFQRTTVSSNGIWVDGPSEKMPIQTPPGQNLTSDFRDPAIFVGPSGVFQMVVGSRDHLGGVVLLYGTDDPLAGSGWNYEGILHRDGRLGMAVAECSNFQPLGPPEDNNTLWALVYSQMLSTCPLTGRTNLSPIIIGRFDGRTFTPLFEQEFDFGTSAYAFQMFKSDEGVLGIAWLANWSDWPDWKGTWIDFTNPTDFPSALTLPRRIVVSPDQKSVLTPPIETIVKLRDQTLDGIGLKTGKLVNLPTTAAEIIIVLDKQPHQRVPIIRLDLGHTSLQGLGIQLTLEGLEILHADKSRDKVRLLARDAQPQTLRVFLDAGSIEVFADGGRWTGTHRLSDQQGLFTTVQLSGELERVNHVDAWKMKSAIPRGHYVAAVKSAATDSKTL